MMCAHMEKELMTSGIEGVGGNTVSGGVQNPRKKAALAQTKDIIEVKMPSGRGLQYLANANGMTLDEFCKLNGITKDYKAKADEVFYVVDKAKKEQNSAAELGQKIYETSGKYRGAVGRVEFDILIKKINSKNVEAVLKNYTKKESLINTITSEISSDQQKRKNAVMHIYNALAEAKKTPDAVKKRFQAELNKQFDSFGMVSTKKLDKIMNLMMLSPKGLADKIYSTSDKYGAVGKEDFDILIDLISPHNVESVLMNYTKKESLINTITSEITSSQQKRKDAVMKVYDALAKAKNIPAEKRTEFVNELNAQFSKKLGMVNTEKLDKIISEMIQSKGAKTQVPVAQDNTKVHLTNGKTTTVSQLRKDARKSAELELKKKFQEYCKANGIIYREGLLDLSPLYGILAPTVNKNGRIVTKESELMLPTTSPNGKVVIVNPGHGGYRYDNGYFDPGCCGFKLDKGKYKPLMEFDITRAHSDYVVEKLRSQGYAVVLISGNAKTMKEDNSIQKLVTSLNTGRKAIKKYDKKDIMFISLHVDSIPKGAGDKKGAGICYDPSFNNDTVLANLLRDSLSVGKDNQASVKERIHNTDRSLHVLEKTEDIPSVLIEIEFVNGENGKNLDDPAHQILFANKLTDSINEYFKSAELQGPILPKSDEIKVTAQGVNTAQSQINGDRAKYIKETKKPDHKVASGETCSVIARKYGVEVKTLMAYNNMTSPNLQIGQVLKIPPVRSITGVTNLDDVAKAMGLSQNFIKGLKKLEDGGKLSENEFHTKPYTDKAGNETIGIGHVLKQGDKKEMTKAEVCTLLVKDLLKVEDNLIVILGGKKAYDSLPQAIKESLIDMSFNKGVSIVENNSKLLGYLKAGNYEQAINEFTFIKSIATGKEMSGLAKRRLFDISLAVKTYNGSIPKTNISTIENLYKSGVELLRKECGGDSKKFANVVAGYNKDIQEYFGNSVKLKFITK